MLQQPGMYDQQLMKTTDPDTSSVLKNKIVQVYNYANKLKYSYADNIADSIPVSNEVLNKARREENIYFMQGDRDAVIYFDRTTANIILFAAYDKEGKMNLSRLRILLFSGLAVSIVIAFISGYFFSRLLPRQYRRHLPAVKRMLKVFV
jgi:hypothetical protein